MKTLIIDIETTPHRVDTWGLWNQNVGINQIHEPTGLLCFAAKWRGERTVTFRDMRTYGDMVDTAHRLVHEADAVVGFNHIPFDMPHLNREFLVNHFTPPAPYKNIDLLRVFRKQFKFASNKLAYVAAQLLPEGETKVKHEGHELWIKCIQGDEAAWEKMKEYNIQDVLITEKLYNLVVPWIPGHPNVALIDGTGGCPQCGRAGGMTKQGFSYTGTGKYQRYKCGCGSWSTATRRTDGVELKNG